MDVSFPTKEELERQAEQEEKFEKFEAKINQEPRVASLRKRLVDYQKKIISAERVNKDLDKFSRLVKDHVRKLQKVYGGPNAIEANEAAVNTQRSILSRRINAAVRQKEKLRGEKLRLRENIEELRREKRHLQEVRAVLMLQLARVSLRGCHHSILVCLHR